MEGRPVRHTPAELAALLELLAQERVTAVTLGHGRDADSVAAAEAFLRAWDGTVLAVVDWPDEAASWLRQARRFTAVTPDAWVVASTPEGWARMSGRLRQSTGWDPRRTFGFASAAGALAAAGPGTLAGMRGAAANGDTWHLGRHLLTTHVRT